MRWTFLATLLLVLPSAAVVAAPGKAPTFTNPAEAGVDYTLQGEYEGDVADKKTGVQVIALGEGAFQSVVYRGGLPGAGWDTSAAPKKYEGKLDAGQVVFKGDDRQGTLRDGTISVADSGGTKLGELKRVERKSPTLGQAAPAGATVLFDGSGLEAFKGGMLTDDKLLTPKGSIFTIKEFKDFTLHLEFRTPFMPSARGQARGNSGLYIINRYECQILDSFGLSGENNECGGFYTLRKPDVNMCLPPLQWQTYDVDFTAPRFDDAGNKTAHAKVTVRHNGVVIHGDYVFEKLTPGGLSKEGASGPLQLQDHGNPVTFRNIWIVEKK